MKFATDVRVTWQQGETATLEEHQQALFLLLEEFDRVARQLHTPYFLFAGTLLGAVRHKGFIPWDDDLDVLMMREDYERFLREAPKLLNKELFYLQGEFSEHWPMFFSKLRLNGTTCLEKYHPKDNETHQGVYMDIFPCDHACKSKIGRIFQFVCSKVVIAKGLDKKGYDNAGILKKTFMICCRMLPRALFQKIVQGPGKQTGVLHSFLGGASKYSRNVYPASVFQESVLVEFVHGRYPAPKEYDKLLTVLYGDYMRIPSESERKVKEHALLVDLRKPYQEYEHYREGMTFDVHTRSIR